jgi:hypothetical protein
LPKLGVSQRRHRRFLIHQKHRDPDDFAIRDNVFQRTGEPATARQSTEPGKFPLDLIAEVLGIRDTAYFAIPENYLV